MYVCNNTLILFHYVISLLRQCDVLIGLVLTCMKNIRIHKKYMCFYYRGVSISKNNFAPAGKC